MSIDLTKIPTIPDEKKVDKEKIKEKTQVLLQKISDYQRMMYAQGKYSILLILQGMDAAGKDGTIKDIFTCINPLGCTVSGFKKPTPEESAHDFLWRIHQHAPEKGMIKIFNRSHYEDVLVPAVEWYVSRKDIEKRYKHINNFEDLLEDHNTTVIKCYLHISPERQKEKLEERIELSRKHWKHNDGDWESREKWDSYMTEYHKVFKECDKTDWHVIPADKNWWKVHNVCLLLVEAFEKMDLEWPDLDSEVFGEEE